MIPDLHTLSDEELLALPDDEDIPEDAEESPEEDSEPQEMPEDDDETETSETEDDDTSDTDDDDEVDESAETDEPDEEEEPDSDEDDTTDNDEAIDAEGNQEDDADDETSDEDADTDNDTDVEAADPKFKDFFEALTKPFRANGKDMTVTDPNDIIALMQQGANYSQKMAKLKPQMAIIKTLEEHDLTNPEQLSYLIDLHNKDPKAIAKLVKESEIDIYEFDMEQGKDYVPSQKVKEETPFESTVNDLRENKHFTGLLTEISNGWDKQSKTFVADNPNVLRALTEQRKSGMYQKIVDTIEYERTVGRLNDMPYVEAYSIVEQRLAPQEPASQEKAPESFKAPRPTTKAKKNIKRQKASSPKGSGGDANPPIDYSALSDEELMAMD